MLLTTRHLNITITGRVQGVGYRYAALNKARQLNIKGFVKNKPNGSVYIEAEGTSDSIGEFVRWCRKGPDFSEVENVAANEGKLKGFNLFEVKF